MNSSLITIQFIKQKKDTELSLFFFLDSKHQYMVNMCSCVRVCVCVSERMTETVHLVPSFCPKSLMVSEALSAALPMVACVCLETSSAAVESHSKEQEIGDQGVTSSVGKSHQNLDKIRYTPNYGKVV